ncbi:MAG TPA: CopD family protein [Acidobacteriaceae bacterium]|nr:CopD family protein [Acidobacteriaceae bacterium]
MIWFVRDFDLLSLILRAVSFALEALTLGALFFLIAAARPAKLSEDAQRQSRRTAAWCSLALAATQLALLIITSAVLMGSNSGMGPRDLLGADYFLSGAAFVIATLLLFVLLQWVRRLLPAVLAGSGALAASVSLSHAASRMDHRPLLLVLTAAHHLGMAAWLGAMPFLLLALRRTEDAAVARSMARRFSSMAVVSVAVLILAGAGLSWFYAASWQGLYGTSYGILLSAKIVLTLVILTLGAGNSLGLRSVERDPAPLLLRLRRFSEAELGLGFTVILAAASLTAQSPSVDETPQDILSGHQIVQRMEWHWPSFRTPALTQLAPPTPLSVAVREATYTGGSASDANDRAWSEYNHHWAGLIVLVAGGLALLSRLRGQGWVRQWPLLFLGLAVFILIRADPECWPLGPRPFWASFTAPDVLEHRLYALLITAFAAFEWGVQTGRLHWPRARFIFPLLCAAGGALLLTHTHALGEGTDEVFAELSHTPMAVLGAIAGWARWLELRLESGASEEAERPRRIAAWVWPACLILIGLLLLNYRES